MSLMLREVPEPGMVIELELTEILFRRQTRYQEVLIAETQSFGRGLFIDGSPQSFASDEGLYHAALVQPAMFSHPRPERVLIAGGGEGATLREVLRHPGVKRATMVDIDEELVAACREHLPRWSQGAFEDPRAELVHADVFAWLEAVAPGSFDVIVLDLGDPLEESPSQRAFTREFYATVERALAPGGVVVTQACELDLAATHAFRAVRSTLATAFPHTVPYAVAIPSFFANWGYVLGAREALPAVPPDLE
ncbi:MAG: methyltransferase domain-containing protein, partial [Myxococcales bacterium]